MNDELLGEFLDEKLPPDEAEALLRDPAVRAEIEAQLQLDAALGAHLGDRLREERVCAAVLATLGAADEAQLCAGVTTELRDAGANTVHFPAGRLALALAACLAVGFALWRLMLPQPVSTQVIAQARSTPVATGVEMPDDLKMRSAAQWPFAADSPWNLPLGDGARFDQVQPADFATRHLEVQRRHVIISDPRLPSIVLRSPEGETAEVHALAQMLRPGSGPHPTVIVSPSRKEAVEYFSLAPREDSEWLVQGLARIDLHGSGHWPETHGVGEASFPALAGLVREGDWQRGIRHALAIAVPVDLLDGAQPAQWPAHLRLPGRERAFTARGNLRLGTLIALPPEVKPERLGFDAGAPEVSLARAFQDYGAYVVAGSLPGDPVRVLSADGAVAQFEPTAIQRLMRELLVVTNNREDSPGGGGVRRRELAPPLRLSWFGPAHPRSFAQR